MRYLFILLWVPLTASAGYLSEKREERRCAQLLAASVPVADLEKDIATAASGRIDLVWTMRRLPPLDLEGLAQTARALGLKLTYHDVSAGPGSRIVGTFSVEGGTPPLRTFLSGLPASVRAVSFTPGPARIYYALPETLEKVRAQGFAQIAYGMPATMDARGALVPGIISVVRLTRYFAPRFAYLKLKRRLNVRRLEVATLEEAVQAYQNGFAFAVIDGVPYAIGNANFLNQLRGVVAADLAQANLTNVRDVLEFLR